MRVVGGNWERRSEGERLPVFIKSFEGIAIFNFLLGNYIGIARLFMVI